MTAIGLLAATVHARGWPVRSPAEDDPDPLEGSEELERAVVENCRAALSFGSAVEGADSLFTIVPRAMEHDPAMGAAALLVACVSAAERDRYDVIVPVLRESLEHPSLDEQNGGSLVKAALQGQLALRLVESGQSGSEPARAALEALQRLVPESLPSFTTSKGTARTYERTCRRIIDVLQSAITSLILWEAPLHDERWQDVVRREAPVLLLETEVVAGHAYAAFVKEQFERTALSTARTFGGTDGVDARTWGVLLHHELSGNLQGARHWRMVLGQLRILRPAGASQTLSTTDALQLLRHSRNMKAYREGLAWVRANGPLESLRSEALSIARHRRDPRLLGEPELKGLAFGAQVFAQSEAEAAFAAVVDALKSPNQPIKSGRSYQHPAVRLESLLEAATALAPIAETSDELARALLELFGVVEAADELAVRAIAGAVDDLDWDQVSAEIKNQWRAALAEADRNGIDSEVTRAVAAVIGFVGPQGAQTVGLGLLIERLNQLIRGEIDRIPLSELEDGKAWLRSSLRSIRSSAHNGLHSFGGVAPAEVAVGLALEAECLDLWGDIIAFLTDDAVSRHDKAPAFVRMSRAEASKIPPRHRLSLEGAMPAILDQAADPFLEAAVDPFPQALQAAAALNLLDSSSLMLEISKLTGSRDARPRVEGARALVAAARGGVTPDDWIVALALQMSRDDEATVKSHAGQALAVLSGRSRWDRSVLLDRLGELLGEDGLVAPLLVLRGLSELDAVPDEVRGTVNRLAREHIAYGIRLQARALTSTFR